MVFSRLLFIIIFRPEMLTFHPYSILTGDTMVEFVIFCVLRGYCPYIYTLPVLKSYVAPSMGSSSINDLFFFPEQDPDVLAAVV